MVLLALFLSLLQSQPRPRKSEAIVSTYTHDDLAPIADPTQRVWNGVPGVRLTSDFYGKPVPLDVTEVRSRWNDENLFLLYICPYNQLYLKSGPVTAEETNKLWDWDVVEAFIGSDFQHIGRYREFQVSPQSEFVDLDINRDDPRAAQGVAWQSGFTVRAHIDRQKRIWYGEMRIPLASLSAAPPKAGDEFRIGLFRIEGSEPSRIYIAWPHRH
jgi:hypothetical protein